MTVREVIRTGPIARWLYNRDWRAVTLPSWRGITVRYWWDWKYRKYQSERSMIVSVIDNDVRRHEWSLHVAQIRKLGKLRYLYTYARAWLTGYLVARKYLHLSRAESARHAYDSHPLEQEDWDTNLL